MNTTEIYNIIGDIHGRTNWKDLVREDAINIFVGDYFDAYEYISPAEQMYNFRELVAFAQNHPQTVLLYGNHDLHYLIASEHYSRYEPSAANDYWRLFMETEPLFYGVAYPIGNKALVTHAGVTRDWYEKYFGSYQSEPLDEVARRINGLWKADKEPFTFDPNATEWGDHYGTSPTHSPLWIRPETLKRHDLFAGAVKQIYGHSQTGAGVTTDRNMVCVDCLGTRTRSYIITL